MSSKKKTELPEEELPQQETAAEQPAEEAEKAHEADEKASEADEKAAETDRYLRLAAEYDNYRKRSAKEREAIYTDVKTDTVAKFLPVYDNLERAMAISTADEAYKKGVEMTFNQLCEVFKKLGVEEIEAVGKTFDPNYHNAVMHVEDEEKGESEIVEEFQKGFKVGEKVIRFSMVKVAN